MEGEGKEGSEGRERDEEEGKDRVDEEVVDESVGGDGDNKDDNDEGREDPSSGGCHDDGGEQGKGRIVEKDPTNGVTSSSTSSSNVVVFTNCRHVRADGWKRCDIRIVPRQSLSLSTSLTITYDASVGGLFGEEVMALASSSAATDDDDVMQRKEIDAVC